MNKLITLPTFLLYRMMRPFLPSNHLLKKKVSVQDWYDKSTDLNKAFAIYFWIAIPLSLTLILYICR